ncbi:MAG: peptidoglycan-binding domain-containing protein, partial [bacterium]|nr:peptidoglycan-binding domain-containing protein [bacterium]
MGTFIPTGGRMTRVIVSLSTAAMLSGVGALLPQVALAVTIDELLAQIAALQAQVTALQGASTPAGKCSFTRDLTVGVTGDDVKCLQQYLNSTANKVASSGVGSPGSETMYFGSLTRLAVSAWQSANSVSPTAGYFGSISRAKYNSLVAGAPAPTPTPTPPGTPPPAATGTGLTVAAATQPGDTLAPKNSARVPTTKFTLTASSDGDVKVNSITVERQGPSGDSSVDGVVLLGEDGLQIGLSKKLNSNHQAVLNESLTIKAGTSKTYTIAINRPSTASDGGDIVKMAVMAIDAGAAAVNGSLPIVGSPITMNSSLTIGTVTLTRGVNDPGTGATKEIGTTGYKLTAIRITAGSAEDLKVKWVSVNQSGSAATTDLKNIKVNFDGTDYPVTVSADGKYYTANFGDGVVVTKGNTKEFYVSGDIESGTNRSIDFDLYRYTDLYVVGSQFGYGLTPTATDSGDSSTDDDGTFQATNPVWDAYEATIGAGSLSVTKSTAIPTQNIAVNLNEQPIGAFDVEVKGEDVNVTSMIIRVSANKNDTSVTEADYTQVSLYDNTTGKVVAGPLDGSGTTDAEMIFTFTDSVSFPVGKRTYVLKGKLSTDFDSDTLVSASTTPNGWTATGAVSGNTITPSPTTAVTGNSFTVKTATSSLSLSNEPTNQNVVAGTTGFTFAKVLFDGTSSGEDVRFTSAQFAIEYDTNVGGAASRPTNCQLFDGTTALNTGTNVVNPGAAGQKTFTLDKNLVLPKGTLKTIDLKCDVPGNATASDTIEWKINIGATFGATGLTSGNTVTPTLNNGSNANSTDNNNKMTIQSGG